MKYHINLRKNIAVLLIFSLLAGTHQASAYEGFFESLFGFKKIIVELSKKLKATERAKRQAEREVRQAERRVRQAERRANRAERRLQQDEVQRVRNRDDIRPLPDPLRDRLIELARRPHTYVPQTAFSEADDPSLLFQYYLLDTTEFQRNERIYRSDSWHQRSGDTNRRQFCQWWFGYHWCGAGNFGTQRGSSNRPG